MVAGLVAIAAGAIGVAMPTQTSSAGSPTARPSRRARGAGYEVDLQFANDDIPTQSQQIDQMITKGATP
jgi:putative multiple sugar transport system substrate-binding protein